MKEFDSANLQELKNLHKIVNQMLQKLDRKLKKQQEELEESRKHIWYKQIADSILANASYNLLGKVSKATIENIYTHKEETISLNPRLDASANAQLLYKKAKRAKRGEEISVKKVDATKNEIKDLIIILKEIESSLSGNDNCKTLQELQENVTSFIGTTQSQADIKGNTQIIKDKIPYRHFCSDGWDFYMGKTDTQNDELSTRFAKPSDIWLHVAGYAGSHVVIKRPKETPFPPSEILSIAASLAAWFSKAKHTSFCEVHYTEARFVHKRKHAPAGEVIAERCKTLRVSPRSPQDLFKVPFLED